MKVIVEFCATVSSVTDKTKRENAIKRQKRNLFKKAYIYFIDAIFSDINNCFILRFQPFSLVKNFTFCKTSKQNKISVEEFFFLFWIRTKDPKVSLNMKVD